MLFNYSFCGGFIINNFWVGCAAHCTVGRAIANTVVVVGAHNRITGGISHGAAQIINHEGYSSISLNNDISVVRVSISISFTANVQPIPLGATLITSGGAVGSGWGQTSNPGSAAADLQFVAVSIITNDDCRSRLSVTQAARILDGTICSLSPSGQGKCMGDSGGPLTQNGQVIGAVSWGVPCGGAAPDMYARISQYRTWILNAIG